ncbi:MAG: tyrosine-type recombinase/integrase [Oligoflexales bacterium]
MPDLQEQLRLTDYIRCISPSGTYRKFRIQGRNRETKKWFTIKSEALDAINQSYLNKHSSLVQAKQKCDELLRDLYKKRDQEKPIPVFHSNNLRILEDYLESEYPPRRRRKLVSFQSICWDVKRAVGALENHPLDTTDPEVLQNFIDTKFEEDPSNQRRIVMWLNSILKFLKKDYQLVKFNPNNSEVKYLTLAEFNQVLPKLTNNKLRITAGIAWHTGLRFGEIFGVEDQNIHNDSLRVISQMNKEGSITNTKTKKARAIALTPEARKYLCEWVQVPYEEKLAFRKYKVSEKFKQACKEVFPHRSNKHLKFHDLRHSHAIHLFAKGVSLGHVAQQLGNSITVCEKHYVGYCLTADSLKIVKDALKGI